MNGAKHVHAYVLVFLPVFLFSIGTGVFGMRHAHAEVLPFQRVLYAGMEGEDVRALQKLLNSSPDTRVALSGPGSPGSETTYYGSLTAAAVTRFQIKYAPEVLQPLGLTRGTGLVGRYSMMKLNQIAAAPAASSPAASSVPASIRPYISSASSVAIPAAVQSTGGGGGGGGGPAAASSQTPAAAPVQAPASSPVVVVPPVTVPPKTTPPPAVVVPPAVIPPAPAFAAPLTAAAYPAASIPSSLTGLGIGPKEIAVSTLGLNVAGLTAWADGTMGVIKSGSQYTFYAANSSSVGRAVGTLDNPVANGSSVKKIGAMKHTYAYAGGGPVYKDPATNNLIMIYHSEKDIAGDPRNFWSSLGMAKSSDNGASWTDLGEIITPFVGFDKGVAHEITGGSFVLINGYMYVYFRDKVPDGAAYKNGLAVARARVSDIAAAAQAGTTTLFSKYYNGAWTQPGLGGYPGLLEPSGGFSSVSYNSFIGKYIMVSTQGAGVTADLYLMESADGISWSGRIGLESEPGESYVPTIVGTGADPAVTGSTFYIYYTYSDPGGWGRWNTSVIARRLITLPGAVPPVVASAPPPAAASSSSSSQAPAPAQTPAPMPPQTYRASADFSGTQGSHNWYYMDSAGNKLAYDSSHSWWQGSETYLRIGSSWAHPGDKADVIRRWIAPSAGAVKAGGNISDGDAGGGDGVRVSILHNGISLWSADIDNGGAGATYDLSSDVPVAAGDTIDFVVNKKGTNSFDSTSFDPLLVFTPTGPLTMVTGNRYEVSGSYFAEDHSSESAGSYLSANVLQAAREDFEKLLYMLRNLRISAF